MTSRSASLRALALGAALLAAGAPLAAESFTFTPLNRSYRDLAGAAVPVSSGAFSLALRSPHQTMVLRSHRLMLTPVGDGTHRADLDVTFLGKGSIVADVALGGAATQLADEVVVPPQRQVVHGRVKVQPTRDGGYLVTPLELPRTVTVAIQSGVGNRILGWCEGIAAIPFSNVDCDEVGRAVQHATVALPGAGTPFALAPGDLAPAEKAAFDAYLRRSAAPGAGR